tara:strand:- start:16523 stop:18043 length:1521 start_codon:yes stop_codon:yes gene_type:complete
MRRRYYRRKKGIAKKEQPFFKEGNAAVQTKEEKQPFFQTKGSEGLTVGQPGDKYEVEADAMADAVMNNAPKSAAIQRKEISGIQRAAAEEDVQAKVQRQVEEEPVVQTQGAEQEEVQMQAEEEEVQMQAEEEEVQMQAGEEEVQTKSEEEEVQMKVEEEEVQMQTDEEEPAVQAKSQGKLQASKNLSHRIKLSGGNGRPIAPKAKHKMETAFGVDFSAVNIHTNSNAVEMNQELRAHAFAHGNDVYFNQGKYQPETSAGQHLLAHELTHVVQQRKNHEPAKINPMHFASGYTSWAAAPHVREEGEARSYTIDFNIRAALEINLVEGLDSSQVKSMIEQALNRHGGGWKNITNENGEMTRVFVNFNINWISFDTISTEVYGGQALGVSILPNSIFEGIPIDGLFEHDGDTNRIILKGGPATDALLRGRRNRRQREQGEIRFGNEITHEMGHALGLEHRAHTVMNRANTQRAILQFSGDQIRTIIVNITRDRNALPSWISQTQVGESH